jgi:hypothetical protein
MIHRHWSPACAFGVLAAALVLSGCGGGGGGSAAGGGGTVGGGVSRSATVGIYLTDQVSSQYAQVLVTVYSVALSTDGKTYTPVYTSTTGQTVDVASLSNVISLIGNATIPAGTYVSAQVTVGDSITLEPRGGGSGSSLTISQSPTSTTSNGETTITFPLDVTVSTNAQNQVVIDFNLAGFEIVGGHIVPSVRQGGSYSSYGKRNHTFVVDGTVENLVAGQSFTLQFQGSSTLTIDISSQTSIYNSSDGSTATLANGDTVSVQGTIDPTTGIVTATNIRVNQPSTTIRKVAVYGSVSNPTSTGFTVTVINSEGFQPTGGTVTAATSSSTRYHLPLTGSANASDVAAGDDVIVTGSLDVTTQTITANRVDIYPPQPAQ